MRKRIVEAGEEWMWANWGVRWLIRSVTFSVGQRDGGKAAAVFRFASED